MSAKNKNYLITAGIEALVIIIQIGVGVATVAAVRTDVGWLKQGMKELKERVTKLENKNHVKHSG